MDRPAGTAQSGRQPPERNRMPDLIIMACKHEGSATEAGFESTR
jgi:hypothetical protein